MTAALKHLLRAALPASLHAALTRHRRLRFTGPYRTWSDARAASYPAWIFSPAYFIAFWGARSVTLTWHPCTDGHFTAADVPFDYRSAGLHPLPGK